MHRILVVGDPMIDEYVYGVVSRVNPEAPCVLLDKDSLKTIRQAGGALNVAKILARGAYVWFVGPRGLDGLAPDVDFIERDDEVVRPYFFRELLKTRFMHGDTTLLRVDTGKKFSARDAEEVLLSITNMNEGQNDILYSVAAVVVSDYDKGTVTQELVQAIADRVHSSTVIVIDSKRANYDIYKPFYAAGLDVYITVNQAEWEDLNDTPEAAIVSMGANGLAVFIRGEETFRYKTSAAQVRSVVGAGDVVTAIFTLEMVWHGEVAYAAQQAEIAATRAVELPRTSNDV